MHTVIAYKEEYHHTKLAIYQYNETYHTYVSISFYLIFTKFLNLLISSQLSYSKDFKHFRTNEAG